MVRSYRSWGTSTTRVVRTSIGTTLLPPIASGTGRATKLSTIRDRPRAFRARERSSHSRGDFDFNGYDDIFWYQPGSGADYIWWNASGGFSEVTTEVTGTYEPFVGDFDGDGRRDIFWYQPGSGADHIWWGNSNKTFTKLAAPDSIGGTYNTVVGDFDGNGATDIVWNVAGSSASSINDHLWLGRAFARDFHQTTFAILGDAIPLAGDFDGSGTDDMFLYTR